MIFARGAGAAPIAGQAAREPRNKPWDQHRETSHCKRYHDRRQRSDAAPGLHRRRQPHAVHPRARPAGTVHASRSCSGLRVAARPRQPFVRNALNQVILGCSMSWPTRCTPRASPRCASAWARRSPRSRWRSVAAPAFSRSRSPTVHPPSSADLILAGGAEALSHVPRVSPKRGRLVCTAVRRPRSVVAGKGRRGFRPSFLQPVVGLERGLTDPVVELNMGQLRKFSRMSCKFPARRPIRGREPAAARARPASAVRRRARALHGPHGKVYDHDDGVRRTDRRELASSSPPSSGPGQGHGRHSSQFIDGAS